MQGGGGCLERDEHEPVALHGDLRAKADEGVAERVVRDPDPGWSGETARLCGVFHGHIVRGGRASLGGTRKGGLTKIHSAREIPRLTRSEDGSGHG